MPRERVISKIKKRDGSIVEFDQNKIAIAIGKAMAAAKAKDGRAAAKLSAEVVEILERRFVGKVPGVEDVQNIVEEVLIKNGYTDVARAYILYRQKRAEIREAKRFLGVTDDLKLGVNAVQVLKRRYLLKDEEGRVIETPSQMFRRVAKAVAEVDSKYDGKADVTRTENEFYRLMADLEFLPNSPTLMNAGTDIGQLSACFVLPVGDSIEGIFDAVKYMAIIHKSGGGTGFSFSNLRPEGDLVRKTKGTASGPVSFMRVFDTATDVIKQGGRRRGANIGILRVDHPDILNFITAKGKEGFLSNFNISVAVTDSFMRAVEGDKEYELKNPATGKVVKRLKAKDVFDLIVTMAWKTGDPGLVFIDEINRKNPTPHIGEVESTNPCGEQPLLPFESCNLGSINLARMVEDRKIDWKKLGKIVGVAIHFLDNVIDANQYPLPQIEEMTKNNRKIGLGVMGFAEALIKMRIPYDSEKALETAEKIMKFIRVEAEKESMEIARKRGSFPNFKGSVWEKKGYKLMRNASLTTIAPTGTISVIAGTTSGIEPLFAVSFVRNVMEGTRLLEVNADFEEIAKQRGFYSRELMMSVAKKGSARSFTEIPEDVRRLFGTALDIDPKWHVKVQAAFQKYVDNAVAKTINLPQDATPEDVRKAFLLAYKLRCKGITVYRYGSKKEQVLYIGPALGERPEEAHVSVDSEYSGGCPAMTCPF